ncbi:hypothetical protein SDC9_40137 [bioreactor metagenome]|uniref:Uncharacterized protein n=1 Tax=bioreactor metagenome TaxID=1076179 RepID=A0A644VRH1_9ZZZZ
MRSLGIFRPRHQRQIEKDRRHRHRRSEGARHHPLLDLVRGLIDRRFDPHRLDRDRPRLFQPVEPVAPRSLGRLERHDVPRAQMAKRRRQRKPRRVACHPRFGKPALGKPLRLCPGERERQLRSRHRAIFLVGEQRLGHRGLEIAIGLDIGQPHPPRHLGRGRATRFDHCVALRAKRQPVAVKLRRNAAVPHPEDKPALALERLEAIGQHQRLQLRPPALAALRREAAHQPVKPADVDRPHPGALADLGHDTRQRLRHRATGNPVPACVILGIGPKIGTPRKGRVRPAVPGPDMGAAHIDHRPAVKLGDRVVRRLAPIADHGAQVLHLDQLVTPPVREMGQARFRTFRIEKLVGLVRTLVDRGAAHLGEPDGFRARHPGGRRGPAHARHALVMGILPPAANVLHPPDPGLALGAIGDRRADLRRAVFLGCIEPVESLATGDIGLQVVKRIDRAPMGIEMLLAVAPVRKRHVIVDADEIDVLVGPERIEVEIAVAVARGIARIFRPVGGIADLAAGPEDRAHLRGKDAKGRNRRKAVSRPADLVQRHHLGADAKGLDPAGHRAQMRVMQDEAAHRPFRRPRVANRAVARGEITGLRRTEEGRHFGLGGQAAVGAARPPRRDRERDPPAPGQDRLAPGPAPGVGQRVTPGLVHQDEGIEGHRLARRAQGHDRLDHRGIGRSAAIDRRAGNARYFPDLGAGGARDLPAHPCPFDRDIGHLRAHRAVAAAQVAAEPGHDQRHRLAGRQLLVERSQRLHEIGSPAGRVLVHHLGHRPGPRARLLIDRRRRQRVFAGARDHRHRAQPAYEIGHRLDQGALRRPHHLERELRHPVAIGRQLQILEDDIGDAAIGRRGTCALHRLDLRIGQLVLGAGVDAHGHAARLDLDPVRPDPSHAQDLALAQRNRKAHRIAVAGGGDLRRALAAFLRLLRLEEAGGPDHLPANPHPPPDAANRRALARARQPQPVDPPGLHPLRSDPQQPLVDHLSKRRPDRPPDHRARQADNRAAKARPDHPAHGGKQQRRHQTSPSQN